MRNGPSLILSTSLTLCIARSGSVIFSHFSLFKFYLVHNFNHIANNSRPMFDVQTLKFKAIVLVRSFSTPLARPPNEFVISSSDEFEDVDLASDDVFFNIFTALKRNDGDTF